MSKTTRILLSLCLLQSGTACTLMVNADRQQCEKDEDCSRHGAAYSHYTCDRQTFVCIAPAVTSSGGAEGQAGGSSLTDDAVSGSGGSGNADGDLTAAGGSQPLDGLGLGGTGGQADGGPRSGDARFGSGGVGNIDGGRAAAGGSLAAGDGSPDGAGGEPAAGGSSIAAGGIIGQAGGNSGGASSSTGSGGGAGGSTIVLGSGGSTGGSGGAAAGGAAAGGDTTGGTATGGSATGGSATGGSAASSGGAPGSGGAATSTGGDLGSGGDTTSVGGDPGSGGATTASGGSPGSGGDSGGSATGGSATGGTSSAPDGGASSDAGGVDAMVSPTMVVSVSLGEYHTCTVTATTGGGSGAVRCWGDDTYGQIGDGTADYNGRYVPKTVVGLSSGVTAVSAGAYHTCAVTTTTGGVKCWGRGDSGQLGDGSTSVMRTTPVDVVGLSAGVVAVSAGLDHTCALLSWGGVRCWGDNSTGQLGTGSSTSQPVPVDVSGLGSGVLSISSGNQFTCATLASGAMCWGKGSSGQLGNGSYLNKNTPTSVLGSLPSGVSSISAGDEHACALLNAGGVRCWGDNHYDQLGEGRYTSSEATPVDVVGLSSADGSGPAMAVAAGSGHTCALLRTGGLMCWGANSAGQLGIGADNSYQSSPVSVPGLPGSSGVAAGGMTDYGHTCAVLAAGGIECWGYNYSGQVGNGSAGMEVRSPVLVPGL
jgi:alpha-tubulin suppressor-like RCC1 family protein